MRAQLALPQREGVVEQEGRARGIRGPAGCHLQAANGRRGPPLESLSSGAGAPGGGGGRKASGPRLRGPAARNGPAPGHDLSPGLRRCWAAGSRRALGSGRVGFQGVGLEARRKIYPAWRLLTSRGSGDRGRRDLRRARHHDAGDNRIAGAGVLRARRAPPLLFSDRGSPASRVKGKYGQASR